MAKTASTQASLFAGASFAFADRFLQDHAGQIISEPRPDIRELIANAYETGATKFDIVWPSEKSKKKGHRTKAFAVLEKHLLAVEELRQLIGSKFIVDPSLCIRVEKKSAATLFDKEGEE
jgi:hypothetical protein